jgi:Tfp pilus assembly protein PilF
MSFFEADPAKVHTPNWKESYTEAGRVIEGMITQEEIDEWDRKFAEVAARPPDEILFRGLGWGALENARAAKNGEQCSIPAALPFDDPDLCAEQQPWLDLLTSGALPEPDPQADPGQYMIQPEWRALLEESIRNGKGNHWYSWLHLGVALMEVHDEARAKAAWEKSVALRPNAWALRNLAVVARKKTDFAGCCDLLKQAWEIGPKVSAIAQEYGSTLLTRKRFDELDEFLKSLPEDVRQQERVRMLAARIALHFDRFDEVEEALTGEFATIQEGELSLSEIWYGLQEKKIAKSAGVKVTKELKDWVRKELEPPTEIDFRMFTSPDAKYVAPQAG